MKILLHRQRHVSQQHKVSLEDSLSFSLAAEIHLFSTSTVSSCTSIFMWHCPISSLGLVINTGTKKKKKSIMATSRDHRFLRNINILEKYSHAVVFLGPIVVRWNGLLILGLGAGVPIGFHELPRSREDTHKRLHTASSSFYPKK